MNLDQSWGEWLKANYDQSKPIKLNTNPSNAMQKRSAIAGFMTALRIIKGQNK